MATLLSHLAAACGAVQTPESFFYTHDYETSIALLLEEEDLVDYEDGDYVLNNMRAGSISFYSGDLMASDDYFSRATSVIDSSIGGFEGVVSLGLWESARYFKGAPYERTALYYYRGLTNYLAGQDETAMICFRNALLVDESSTDDHEFQEDNAAVLYMTARTMLQRGDNQNARVALQKARDAQPDNPYLTLDNIENDNLVLLIESGYGPAMWADDSGHRGLLRRPGLGQANVPHVYLDGQHVGEAGLLVDWFEQGLTEDVTLSDIIQETKACFIDCLRLVGLDCIAGICEATTEADVRAWRFIPQNVWLYSGEFPSGAHDITIRFEQVQDSEGYTADFSETDSDGLPSLIRVTPGDDGYLPAYELSYYFIGVPAEGAEVVLMRTGLGRHAQRL